MSYSIQRKFLFYLARPTGLTEWLEDVDPEQYIVKLKGRADVFTFWERIPGRKLKVPQSLMRYKIFYEQDQIAAIPLVSYDYWWSNQIGKKTRNMIRKSIKSGIQTKICQLNEDLVKNLEKIYNETPIRQGKYFTHYGEKFKTIKRRLSDIVQKYPNDFICAFYNDEMVGFVHLLYSKDVALINEILSMQKHWDKAPNNALIAKAVERACEKGVKYLVYEKMPDSPLGEFKKRNGFKKFPVTRYYIALSLKGKFILTLRLQNGLKGVLPRWLKKMLRPVREHLLEITQKTNIFHLIKSG